MDAKVTLFDERIRPDAGYQLFLGYQCTGIFQEDCEDLERPTAEPERLLGVPAAGVGLRRDETGRNAAPIIGLSLIGSPCFSVPRSFTSFSMRDRFKSFSMF